jgi:hypothetical protein
VDQGGGTLVEELGVVDDQQELPVRAGAFQDGVAGLPEQPQQVARGERPAAGRNGANGPNGMAATARDATAWAVANPSRAADLAASAASRVLPTSAAPASTNAAGSGPSSLARIQPISASRDTRGISPVSLFLTASSFASWAHPRHKLPHPGAATATHRAGAATCRIAEH